MRHSTRCLQKLKGASKINIHSFWLDYMHGFRYATPCIVIGSFISVVALIIALAGPCSSPDRTLVCSSLHILAGIINSERYNIVYVQCHFIMMKRSDLLRSNSTCMLNNSGGINPLKKLHRVSFFFFFCNVVDKFSIVSNNSN